MTFRNISGGILRTHPLLFFSVSGCLLFYFFICQECHFEIVLIENKRRREETKRWYNILSFRALWVGYSLLERRAAISANKPTPKTTRKKEKMIVAIAKHVASGVSSLRFSLMICIWREKQIDIHADNFVKAYVHIVYLYILWKTKWDKR